jgi:hypothetical protein
MTRRRPAELPTVPMRDDTDVLLRRQCCRAHGIVARSFSPLPCTLPVESLGGLLACCLYFAINTLFSTYRLRQALGLYVLLGLCCK